MLMTQTDVNRVLPIIVLEFRRYHDAKFNNNGSLLVYFQVSTLLPEKQTKFGLNNWHIVWLILVQDEYK